jgi:hypothetical protein
MGKTVKNIITGKEITKPDPIDVEVPFDGGVMITETDPAGIITYADSPTCQQQHLRVCGKPLKVVTTGKVLLET